MSRSAVLKIFLKVIPNKDVKVQKKGEKFKTHSPLQQAFISTLPQKNLEEYRGEMSMYFHFWNETNALLRMCNLKNTMQDTLYLQQQFLGLFRNI